MKTQNTRRMHRHKRSYKLRRHKRSYKLRGGGQPAAQAGYLPFAPLPKPVLNVYDDPPPISIGAVNSQIAAQNLNQLNANSRLAGGGKIKGKYFKQRGGSVTSCGGSTLNGLDGYGYIPPMNCTLVPTMNDLTSQKLANDTVNTSNMAIVNAVGDSLGK